MTDMTKEEFALRASKAKTRIAEAIDRVLVFLNKYPEEKDNIELFKKFDLVAKPAQKSYVDFSMEVEYLLDLTKELIFDVSLRETEDMSAKVHKISILLDVYKLLGVAKEYVVYVPWKTVDKKRKERA